MKQKEVRANLLLLLTAAIWGLAFVAQRVGMEHMGPFTFNGIRFALGSLSLLPLLLYDRWKTGADEVQANRQPALLGGILAGAVLFTGASLQQIALVYTTAGKAAFLTSLYLILVPLLGLCCRQVISGSTWAGALFAAGGVYFLSVTEELTIAYGDALALIGAIFWGLHILLIGYYSQRVNVLRLSCIQFIVCALLSLGVALAFEEITLTGIYGAAIPILYGGIASVGIAYTLQVVGQKNAKPAHAAIILSMETIFAAVGGWLLLQEDIGPRGLLGCALLLTGMLLPQLEQARKTSLPQ
ncbi:MAG: DMT family transporter [Sporomusaceae bacterium]|nr:DMT family transporter [Sporomusaceae bacterium]